MHFANECAMDAYYDHLERDRRSPRPGEVECEDCEGYGHDGVGQCGACEGTGCVRAESEAA